MLLSGDEESTLMLNLKYLSKQVVVFILIKQRKLIIDNENIGRVHLSGFNLQRVLVQNKNLLIQITHNGSIIYIKKPSGN